MAHAKILCVDDEPNPLLLRKLVLEKAGYNVLAATCAEQAIGFLATDEVDLLLSDHLMPGMTGTQLAKIAKDKHPNLRVIVISGVNEVPPDAGNADRFVSKLGGPEALLETIADVLAQATRN